MDWFVGRRAASDAGEPVSDPRAKPTRVSVRYVGTVASASTSKFERLIEALLRLSRHGREKYRAEPVDVGAVVEVTLASLRQSIAASGATGSAS